MADRPLTVLLVEDDEDDYIICRELLREVKHRRYILHWTRSWQDALDALTSGKYDACVVDYYLGAQSGLDFIRRCVDAGCPVPMIVLTGGADHSVALEALQSGAADYLDKSDITAAVLDRSVRYAVERAAAYLLLQESRQLLSSTLNALTSHIAILDGSCRIVAVNDAWKNYALALNEECGLGTDYLAFADSVLRRRGEGGPALAAGIRDVCTERSNACSVELMLRSGGEQRWYMVQVTRFLFGERVRVVVAHEDITERVIARKALEEKERALLRSNQDLHDFAHAASHDLQEPLRVVSSYAKLLASRYSGRLDEDADDFIRFICDRAERMRSMISGLLAFSRVGGDDSSRLATVEGAAAVNTAQQCLSLLIEDANAQISVGQLPTVRADLNRLTQAFQNLLANAIKYRRPEVAPVIHVSATQDDREYTICVRDNGIGFAPAQAERVFRMFARLRADEYPGTGVGLALCKRIVQGFGGRMWAESQPGKGSSFYFTLPVNGVRDLDS